MINESPDKLKLKNRAYPWYLGTTFFVYKTPTGKTNYVSSTSSGIDFTLKVNGMDFSKFVPVEMRTQLDHENLVEVLHSLNEKLINKNESRRSFVASGRLWKINSQNYVSFWNEKTNVQKSILDKLMVYLNITYDNTLFEFPSNQNDYKPYDQVGTTSTITKDIDLTPHLDAPMLPAAYAKELRRLKSMNELTRKQWQDSQSTGLGDPDHPVNDDNPHTNKLKAENAEMAQSDITKIIDYSEKLQSMFTVNDNLEDWVKAKLNHACDYVATVRDYLKFYNEEKQKGTENIQEKWTKEYKKSINCSNPKGFSQKAHCRARQLRKAGKTTKSKPVRESYKIAISELLKEQDSSMAMGALKQLNSDAKELESMLQPNTQLEDWVKAKLNLAGEYLDDVYHHLDHFGPQGRKLDEMLKELDYEGGIGFHEFVVFYQKANDQQLASMEDCLKNSNMECVKDLIQKVTGMTMDKIKEAVMNPNFKLNMMNLKNLPPDELEQLILLRQKAKKPPIIIKYGFWIDTDGKIIKVDDHEKWAKEKYPYSANPKLEAFKNGYVRMVYDDTTNKYEFQNMDNGSWRPEGNSVLGIPKVNSKIKLSIMQFMKKKNIMKESSWKGEENYYTNKEIEKIMSRYNTTVPPEKTSKHIWFTPDGKAIVTQEGHYKWLVNNDPKLVTGSDKTSYENAYKKGYVRGVKDYKYLTLDNLPLTRGGFSVNGGHGIPKLSTVVKNSILDFIEKDTSIEDVADGSGNVFLDKNTLKPIESELPNNLDESTENSVSDEEITKKYIQYAKNTIKYLEILKAIKDKFRKKADIGAAIRLAVEKQNIDPNYITLSSVKGILIGLGERNDFTNLSPSDRVVAVKLQSLASVALTHNDGILIKILDLLESDHMNEDLKKTLGSIGLAGLTALGSLGIGSDAQAAPTKKSTNQSITRTVKKNTPKPVAVSKVNTMNVFEKYKSINPYFPDFLNAIHQVESSGKITGNSPIMGDNGRARGPFQIHKEYWEDVKNIVGGKYEDVDNLDYAAKVVASYMLKYAKNAIQNGNFVVAAKRHNGGPNGDKKSATQEYARKVMSKMPSEYAMAKKENINGISIV